MAASSSTQRQPLIDEEKEAKREQKLHKEAERQQAQGKSGVRSQFKELVPGRFYRLVAPKSDKEYVGELKSADGGKCSLDVWHNGQSTGSNIPIDFKDYEFREITREQCFDLSRVAAGLT